jgi:hypothetical protein
MWLIPGNRVQISVYGSSRSLNKLLTNPANRKSVHLSCSNVFMDTDHSMHYAPINSVAHELAVGVPRSRLIAMGMSDLSLAPKTPDRGKSLPCPALLHAWPQTPMVWTFLLESQR